MADFEDPASRLTRLISRMEPRLRVAFVQAVSRLRSEVVLSNVVALLEAGRIDEAVTIATASFNGFAAEQARVVVFSADEAARFIEGKLGVVVAFDTTNFRAVEQMRTNRLRLIQQFTEGQRVATRSALSQAIAEGVNPIEQARRIRGSIGLTANQEAAVANYRRMLVEGDREALTRELRDKRFDRTLRAKLGREPLTTQQIDRMAGRYRERMLKYRSEVIARTESLGAVHQGTELLYEQAETDEIVAELTKEWVSARDARVRDPQIGSRSSHRTMHGQIRRTDEAFTSGAGNSLRYPGDTLAPSYDTTQCRCLVVRRFSRPSVALA